MEKTKKSLQRKNGWIIGEMEKSHDKFKQKWHNNLPLDW